MTTMAHPQHEHSQKVSDDLRHLLADTYLLYLKTQNFHWNVTGPNFESLHLLFEKQYLELADAVDVIAERIRALNCVAPGTFTEFLKLTSLKEETSVPRAQEMIQKLLHDHETISHHASIMFQIAEQANDQVTMDVLIERMREHDKTAWMLRSHLEK